MRNGQINFTCLPAITQANALAGRSEERTAWRAEGRGVLKEFKVFLNDKNVNFTVSHLSPIFC